MPGCESVTVLCYIDSNIDAIRLDIYVILFGFCWLFCCCVLTVCSDTYIYIYIYM